MLAVAQILQEDTDVHSIVQILDAINGRDVAGSQSYIQDAIDRDQFSHVVEKLPIQDISPVEILQRISQVLPEWVLEDVDYKKWIDKHSTDNWLWMLGAAGSGKSHIVKYVFYQLWLPNPQEEDPPAYDTLGLRKDGEELREEEMQEPDDDENGDTHAQDIEPTGSASAIYYGNDVMSDSPTSNYTFRTIVRQFVQQLWAVAPQSAYTHIDSLSALCGDETASQETKPAHKVLIDVARPQQGGTFGGHGLLRINRSGLHFGTQSRPGLLPGSVQRGSLLPGRARSYGQDLSRLSRSIHCALSRL